MQHDAQRGVAADEVVHEGDGDHGPGRGGPQRQASEALDEGGNRVGGHQRGGQEDVGQAEELSAAASHEDLVGRNMAMVHMSDWNEA